MIFNFINLVSFWHVTELSSTNNKWHVDSISLWLLILVIRKSSKHRRISGVKMFDELLRDENCQTAFLLAMNTNNLDIDYAGQIGDDKNELKNIYRIGLN